MNRTTEYFRSCLTKGSFLLLILSFFFSFGSNAQERTLEQSRISITLVNRPFPEALAVIESKTPFKFAYSTELIRQQRNVTLNIADTPLQKLLTILLQGTGLTYNVIGRQIVLRSVSVPTPVTFSGYIKDSRTGESLIGASVAIRSAATGATAGAGVVTNNYGFYSITVPSSDTLQITVSYVGYQRLVKKLNAGENSALSFGLERDYSREEINTFVLANDKREDNIKKNASVPSEIPHDMITTAPSVGSAGDLLTSIELLPGVQAGIDGTPGYFVRGGNAGQNLILLDEATLYNPSHVFGLVSIFNTPAIKHASLMRSGFPASYGDHLSSVLDVMMKDGSNQQAGGVVDMGTVASGLTLFGPVNSGGSTYLLSARRSTTDVLLRPLLHNNYFSNYYFYDVNAKLNFTLSPKDRLLLSFYTGRDNNNYASDSTDVTGINYSMHFGNTTFTARWNHQYSSKLFSTTSVEYNRYHQFLSATQNGYVAQLYSGIRDINARTNLTWYLSPVHKISAGADYLYQTLYPASLSESKPATDSSGGIIPGNIPAKAASRAAMFISDDMSFGERFQLYAGVRTPYYFNGATHYFSVEPRLALLYRIDASTSIKLSYTLMHQYTHLVQSYNSSFPAEIWIGSSGLVHPETSQEFSAGLFRNFKQNIFQTSVEVYYRRLGNQLLFGGSTTPTIDNTIENQVVFGHGWSYGAEFFVRKNRGRWTGSLAYSLAYARQRFDSLNLGQSFPYAFDRRHLLDVSSGYALTGHWRISANFVVASGRAFTLDTDTTGISITGANPLYPSQARGRAIGRGRNQDTVSTYGIKTNNYRLQPYDRLDLSIHYRKIRNTGSRILETEWTFSVYNVYARSNSSFVYRTIDPATKTVIAKQVAFIPIIPSVSYSLKF